MARRTLATASKHQQCVSAHPVDVRLNMYLMSVPCMLVLLAVLQLPTTGLAAKRLGQVAGMGHSPCSLRFLCALHGPADEKQLISHRWASVTVQNMQVSIVPAGGCPLQAGALEWYLDSSTPSTAYTTQQCTGSYQQCKPGARPETSSSVFENFALVFSDEFATERCAMQHQHGDKIWTAVDMYYSSAYMEDQIYKPDKVKVWDGALHIKMESQTSTGMLPT